MGFGVGMSFLTAEAEAIVCESSKVQNSAAKQLFSAVPVPPVLNVEPVERLFGLGPRRL